MLPRGDLFREFREFRQNHRFFAFFLAFIAGMSVILGSLGDSGKTASAQIPGINRLDNTQTCGGIFLWQDVFFFQEWHIQRSVFTGDYRLLDPEAVCRASGSREFCETVLEKYRQEFEIPPMSGRVLILVHGFASGSILLENMALWFREKGDYTAVLNVSYPSTLVTVAEQAEQLAEIVARLDGVERVDFVGHSLGAIVLRYYLGNYADDAELKTLSTAKIGRLVQVCPPNQGASVAQKHNAGPIGLLFPVLADLSLSGSELEKCFGTPRCEFGILAGYGENVENFSEENDAVLPVSTTYLEGASAWKKLLGDHSTIPNSVSAFENIRKFLNDGEFLQEN